ncbi:MAG: EamA family transporter [Myxococcales bacterium]|nr:EamA family transporter [Myxococcales bacterium]
MFLWTRDRFAAKPERCTPRLRAVILALALLSGLLHAAWNVLVKRTKLERGATVAVLTGAWLITCAVLPFTAWPSTLKSALPYVALAGFGEAAYVYALGRAYAAGDLALTYAASRASALVFVWPLSGLFFGTMPSAWAVAASTLVAGGIALATPRTRPLTTPARRDAAWSVPWTLATGLAIGVYHSGYKGAANAGASPVVTLALALSLACPILWLTANHDVRKEAAELVRSPILWLAAAACAGSFLLAIVALARTDSGRVLGLRNSSVAFALLMAAWLGERPSRRQWGGLGVLASGVVLFGLE